VRIATNRSGKALRSQHKREMQRLAERPKKSEPQSLACASVSLEEEWTQSRKFTARSNAAGLRGSRPAWSLAPMGMASSSELLDDLDEFVGFVAVGAGVVEEFFGAFDDGALLGCAGDGDAVAAAELE
jgi:hypothetical protein